MSEKRTFILAHSTARKLAAEYVLNEAPDGWIVTIQERTRNLEQSAKFHALCGDCSKQLKYMGRKLTPAQWKVLFISGHAIATGQSADVIPGLENEFCNIREESAKMSIKRMSSLIEYVMAYGANNGVMWSD